ncbi:uncharacterized protein LOC128885094 [Hylaeus volcanicus]|uniref:uncharacterized protein LOC128885094 n=1 Tax=Hylaeus volcanicus TaxID=313075 RepID=UPI0023B78B54|nr:uncharacterized protein LOC128885094 [Hylaeus volcanicus]
MTCVILGDVSNAVQNLYCELGLNNDNLCPVDGGWTSWNLWGSCSGKCGFKGKRTRYRTCNNPLPSKNGGPCIGPSYQIESCEITGCTMNDYEYAVRNHSIRKGEMKIVKEIHKRLPALIELCFSIDCTFFLVKKILGSNAMHYWNAMNCVKYDVGCPRHGGWSSWGAWSSCSANCGRGQKYRTRTCDSPIPSRTELTCVGPAFELKSCIGFDCKKHSMGTWTNWSKWSMCNVQCGNGIQIRKRSCSGIQKTQDTSCEGSTRDIKGCSIKNCSVNGMWSSWTVWTFCSSSCGIGTQFRNRMCSNPSPSGNGISCFGSASEIRQCFNKPCIVKSHEVAHFTERSSLLYTINGKSSRLLHMYLRFLPLAPFGVLVYRTENNCKGSMCDFVKLSLQNGKIVLLSEISGCTLGLVYEDKLEIGKWHMILAAIYGTRGVLSVNDGLHKISTFSCIPTLYNLDHTMKVGEGFRGQIQEIAINFAPIQLRVPKEEYNQKHASVPSVSNNVQYSMGDDEEGFIYVSLTESIAAPCPKNMEFWQITFAIKAENTNGIVAIIPDDTLNKYILLLLEEGKVKLKFHQGAIHVSAESTEHILIGEWFEVVVVQVGRNLYMQINGNEKIYIPSISEKMITTASNIIIGAIRDEIREKTCPKCIEIPQMSFILGYLNVDGYDVDLLSLPVLDTSSKRFASRTISISDYYEEMSLLLGQQLKISCFYDTIPREKEMHTFPKKTYTTWLLMDKLLLFYGKK